MFRYWCLNPQTGKDERFCDRCYPGEEGSPRREFQRFNHCPLLEPDEWLEGDREQLGPGGVSLLEPDDLCPAWYGRTEASAEIGRALRWKGSLSALYPLGVPEIVIAGVEYAEEVMGEVQAEGRRLDEEDAERRRRRQ